MSCPDDIRWQKWLRHTEVPLFNQAWCEFYCVWILTTLGRASAKLLSKIYCRRRFWIQFSWFPSSLSLLQILTVLQETEFLLLVWRLCKFAGGPPLDLTALYYTQSLLWKLRTHLGSESSVFPNAQTPLKVNGDYHFVSYTHRQYDLIDL